MHINKFPIFLVALFFSFITSIYAHNSKDNELQESGLLNNDPRYIALLGDSMTWIGGDHCEKETGWSFWFKTALPESVITSYARSGATWTNTSSTKGDVNFYSSSLDNENVVYNQALRLINDVESGATMQPQMIIIYAGANDAWFQKRRPGIFNTISLPDGSVADCQPSKFTSLASSVELVCRLLQENLPKAQIVLVTPTPLTKVTKATLTKISDIIDTTGQKLKIPVFRADKKVNFDITVESTTKRKYTTDGVHTSPSGAKYIAESVLDFIHSSLPTYNKVNNN